MKRLAYIPARGGSKGIPGKNVAMIGGKPMIAYTIQAALESRLFDYVWVSTDDQFIADVAVEYGAQYPFLRAPQHAQDRSSTIDAVVSDKCTIESNSGAQWDEFVLLQPTSPFRTAQDITGAVRLFERVHAGVASVSPVRQHPVLMRTVDSQDRLNRLIDMSSTVRRQDMDRYYIVNGAIYVNSWQDLTLSLSFNDNPFGYVMDPSHSMDIDTFYDLDLARKMMECHQDNIV